jgi:hypothetical protein
MPRRIAPFPSFVVVLTCAVAAWGPQAQETVPGDLKPLLAAPQSEMRMVVQRYTLDRITLAGNYANAAAVVRMPISRRSHGSPFRRRA